MRRFAVVGDGWTSESYRRAKFLLLEHVLLDMRFTLGNMRLHQFQPVGGDFAKEDITSKVIPSSKDEPCILARPVGPEGFWGSGICAHGASLPSWGTGLASRVEGSTGVSSIRKTAC
ncbi:hypothetical protein C1Y26_13180 [Pseudomonas sp. MPR-R2A7]|nr:hypothetical protein C1Y23_03640 [Pseudomonas sp. GW460-12]PMX36096.1 hypothetical protein C1Y24_07470 [Pseudomonas sp. MPR-R2A4]PMX40810.1 hypothetical protein C1Y26_13180 [Pseudomonas sp. MPR-R2A7]PMX52390.1 hypothetical protein C1Y17_19120 [Pseudomonas sp. MPR-R2A6]PMX90407.1 hypothetical protein C1Y21_16390 [Pseudomonas sp. MPR-R2A3]PMY12765.1 hypothetical protein C1Y22_14705 [Pseudomonas sp. MPR-R2A5]PNA34205.1 hypothetical protein C1Y16_14350 [Pseudomonas sp. MPR-ANB1]PNA47278.1 hyp